MEALGIDSGDALAQVSLAVWGVMILFWVAAPIGGYFLYRYLPFKVPLAETLALAAGAFCWFIISFAVTLLVLLRVAPEISGLNAVALSLLAALVSTGMTALIVLIVSRRGARRASAEDHAFRVWDEDQRQRKTHHHKRR